MCVMRHQINATNRVCILYLKLMQKVTKTTIQSVNTNVTKNVRVITLEQAVHHGDMCANHHTITNQNQEQHAQTAPPATTT